MKRLWMATLNLAGPTLGIAAALTWAASFAVAGEPLGVRQPGSVEKPTSRRSQMQLPGYDTAAESSNPLLRDLTFPLLAGKPQSSAASAKLGDERRADLKASGESKPIASIRLSASGTSTSPTEPVRAAASLNDLFADKATPAERAHDAAPSDDAKHGSLSDDSSKAAAQLSDKPHVEAAPVEPVSRHAVQQATATEAVRGLEAASPLQPVAKDRAPQFQSEPQSNAPASNTQDGSEADATNSADTLDPEELIPLYKRQPMTTKPATIPPREPSPVENAGKPSGSPLIVVEDLPFDPREESRQVQVRMAKFQEDQVAGAPFEVIEESGTLKVMVRRSKILRTEFDIYRTAVVDPGICDVVQFTPREVSIIGKSQGATHVTFWFEGGDRLPTTYVVEVIPDVEEVKRQQVKYRLLEDVLGELFPDSKVYLDVVANKLIVRGQARDSEEATRILSIISQEGNRGVYNSRNGYSYGTNEASEVLDEYATGRRNQSKLQIVNLLRVPGVQQVALRVKIAELVRSAGRNLDASLAAEVKFKTGDNGHTLFLNSLMAAAAGDMPAVLTQLDGEDLKLGLNFLEQHGVIRMLSEPTLVTMSGRPATFVAGGEFAVPTVVGSAGLNAVTTDFRAFGAILSFLPVVIDKDRIRMIIAPEFSSINSGLSVGGVPGLSSRGVQTTVEMREGQTLAIAGLLDDNMTAHKQWNLPFIGRLLFNGRDVSRTETELIILVTPELIYPMEMEETPPLPGFDVTEPNNAQFYKHGQIEGDPAINYRSTVWPRLKRRYGRGGPAMIHGEYGHGE